MKIERILAENFLGLKRIDIAFDAVTGIFGDNWSGKSSLQQALRICLSGQVERVAAKGDYNLMVREGTKKAQVQVNTDTVQITTVLHSAKAKNASSAIVPVCQDPVMLALLNQHRFSEFMDAEQRRELVFQVGAVVMDKEDVEKRLTEAGVTPEMIEEVGPLLRQGFDGATDYVSNKLKELRAEWKAIAGEVYGSEKAKDWKAILPQSRFAESSQIADEVPTREESVKLAESQEASHRNVVEKLEAFAMPTAEKCKKCERMVSLIDEDAQDAQESLPRQKEALEMLQRATANRRTALAYAKECAEFVKTIEAEIQTKTDNAAFLHTQIAAWQQLAGLIAWDGLPTELAGKVLKAINARLTQTSAATQWPVVQLREDMEITVGGRLWGLCSEAERWTADAALCEALAWVSGHKILVLDRMDVLQPFRRGDLFAWLETIKADGVQSIVFATLKQKPAIEGVASYWLEAGEVAA